MLLEGSHSINKTSLVQALAARVGVILVKINLSGQTGFSDQFSSDLPTSEVQKSGEFHPPK